MMASRHGRSGSSRAPRRNAGRIALLAVPAVLGIVAAACERRQPPAAPPEVAVLAVEPQVVEDRIEFVGEVEAFRREDVRAQVSGTILARRFLEGSEVRAGEVLYRIDPGPYEIALLRAQARLAQAEARLRAAEFQVDRLLRLLASGAIARVEVERAASGLTAAQAAVEDDRGGVDRARKDLDDTVVRAGIRGRVGRALLDLGARVSGPWDVLTTIEQLDSVYVSFRPSVQQQHDWKRDPRAARLVEPGGSVRVQALLGDGSALPETGRIALAHPVADLATGTLQFRARFANPDRLLLPGQVVRVRVPGLTREDAILVPDRAVLRGMGGQTVHVVGQGDSVAVRNVVARAWAADQWLIERGLAPGDRVIVEATRKVAPGTVVRPVPLATRPPASLPLAASPRGGG